MKKSQTVYAAWMAIAALGWIFNISYSFADIALGKNAPDGSLKFLVPAADPSQAPTEITETLLTRNPGTDFVLIDFFTTWCHGCSDVRPIFADLADTIANQATSRFVSVGEDAADVQDYMRVHAADFRIPVGVDTNRDVFSRLGYSAGIVPALYMVDKNNLVVWKGNSLQPDDVQEIKKILADALNQP